MVEAKGEELIARDEVLGGGQGGLFEVGAAEALENVVTLALDAVTVAVRRANRRGQMEEENGRRTEGKKDNRKNKERKRPTKKKKKKMNGSREQRRQSDRLAK